MSFYIRKCLSLLIAISLILTPLLTNIVMAEETPKAVIQLSSENIKVGDVFTADIKFTNLEKYLSSQIAIYFDPNIVKVVDESGNPVDIIYDGISERSDMYSKGKGIFAETGSDVDNENGLLTYSLYIHQDQAEITPPYPVSDGEFTVLTIRFKAIAAGDPKIQFAKENVTPVYDPANPNGSILLTTPGGSKVATEEQIPSITIEGDEPEPTTSPEPTSMPKAVIEISEGNIKVGDTFTADIKFTNLETYLSSQVAIYFDPNVVKVVDESGNPVDIIYDGISERSDMYSKGKGIFAETGSDVDNENGLLTYSLYIHQDQAEITPPYPVSDGEFTVLTIRFKAIAAGDPKIQFAKEGVTPAYDPANPNGCILLTTPGESKVPTEEQVPSVTIGGDEPTIPVTGVSLDKNELTLTVGQTEKLTATVEPSNATNKNVSWSSSDTAVATVASDGTVTAVGAGTATITVTTEDGGKTATCAVTVNAATVPVTGVSLNKSELALIVGQTEKLVATVQPSDATNKNVSWSSSNTAVATVASDGTVTAVGAGTATITVTTEDGGKTATCAVTVNAATVPVTGVSLNKSELALIVGQTEKLVATVQPSDATNKNVSWSSSNTAVATVDADGTVRAVGAGTATITVTTEDGNKTATCTVTVTEPVVNLPFEIINVTREGTGDAIVTATIKRKDSSYTGNYVVVIQLMKDNEPIVYVSQEIKNPENEEMVAYTFNAQYTVQINVYSKMPTFDENGQPDLGEVLAVKVVK